MVYVLAFAIALISTLIIGFLARIVVDLFASADQTARIAAVAFAAGSSLQRLSDKGADGSVAPIALAGFLGSLAATAAFWLYWIGRLSSRYSAPRDD